MADLGKAITQELPHILVLGLLLVLLLFIVTKFQWVRCGEVPGWCNVYCSVNGYSQIGIVTEDYDGKNSTAGIGKPEELYAAIKKVRPVTLIQVYQTDQLSFDLLKQFEVLIVERSKHMTENQELAITSFLDSGGSVIWVGDAGTVHYLTDTELKEAEFRNSSQPFYYESLVKRVGKETGFGLLEKYLGVSFVENKATSGSQGVQIQPIIRTHVLASGLGTNYTIPVKEFSSVNSDPRVAKPVMLTAMGKDYPAVLERKYAGRVIYYAFPPENANPQLLQNTLDFMMPC